MYRVGLITVVFTIFFQPLAAQRSAWDLLLTENPEAVDDPAIGWQDRLILHALTPDQAQRYFSGRSSAEELILPGGQSLAFFLEEKLNPKAHVYIPLISPCQLFEIKGPLAGVQRMNSLGENLSQQGGSSSGCSISEAAAALLIQVEVESLAGFPSQVKLWSPEGPEPPAIAPGQPIDFPLSYQTTLVVPVCSSESCQPGEFELRVSEVAALRGQVVGYFRPLTVVDLPVGLSFFIESTDNNFFGDFAGESITSGHSNSFFGAFAGQETTTGFFNSFFGDQAGQANTTGSNSSYFGAFAGTDSNGCCNSFFGSEAGFSNTSGFANSFFGSQAGKFNTTGSANSFFGEDSGNSNTIGSANSFFGEAAGFSNSTGSANSFFGQGAGFSNVGGFNNSFFGEDAGNSNTSGLRNSFFGHDSGKDNTTGDDNSFFGDSAGENNTTGSDNSIVGVGAGFSNTTGSANAFFGVLSGFSNTTESNNTFIGSISNGATGIANATAVGNRAQVSQSDSLVLGSINGLNGATANVSVGIGTDMPSAPLHVRRNDGTIQIIRAQSTGPEAVRNMMDLINNGIPQFRLVDTSPDGDAWQFSNTNNNLNISLQGSGSQEFLIENDGDVKINNGTVQVTSSRATKENFNRINPEQILKRLADLEVSDWNYRKDPDSVRHLGPVSEDFYRLFGLGDSDKHITPTDLSGVALAAIQGLLEEISILRTRVANLESSQATEARTRGEKSVHSVGEEE